MFKLSVFGKPSLKYNNKEILTAPLPILIATYIVVEHKGKAENRAEVQKIFFPTEPDCPNSFSPLLKSLYEQIWKQAISSEVSSSNIIEIEINSASQNDIELLKKYNIITMLSSEKKQCELNAKFADYLREFKRTDGNSKKELIGKTFSTHIGEIRRTVKKYESGSVNEIIPEGKRGRGKNALTINLSTNIDELEAAIKCQDLNAINNYNKQPFLNCIEADLKIWLSPVLKEWIQQKREEFADKIDSALSQESPSQESQQHHYSNTNYNNISYNYTFNIQPTLSPSHNTFPSHLRKHLLTTMDNKCHAILKKVNWIDTEVKVVSFEEEMTCFLRDKRLLEIFFEKGDGFAILLGDAGTGKSLALHYLAKQLNAKARENIEESVAILFNLADWQTHQPFENWIKKQLLILKFSEQTLAKDFETLVNHKNTIFLLDSFDNIAPQRRLTCLQSINHFVKEWGINLGGVIITSRKDEYLFIKELLKNQRFDIEATIQPLKFDNAYQYIVEYLELYHKQLSNR